MRTGVIVGLTFGLFTIFLADSRGQVGPASPQHDEGWFSLGIGSAFDTDISAFVSGNIGRSRFVQLGLNSNVGVFGHPTSSSASVAVGVSEVQRFGRAAISIGPAFVWSRKHRTSDVKYTVGVQANGQLFFTPLKEFGLGLDLIGNLNPNRSFAGLRLAFVIEGNK